MTLTGKTLEENRQLVEKYAKSIDMVELRVDYLTEEEQLYARRFPAMIRLPCLLTIRRDIDGGLFRAVNFQEPVCSAVRLLLQIRIRPKTLPM